MQQTTQDPTPDVIDATCPDKDGLLAASKCFVLPLMKESGRSSGFFVNQIRYRLSKIHGVKRFKLGHAGTLDPFADGVLLLLGGKATRLQDQYMTSRKSYETVVQLGATTPSLDPDTEVSQRDEAFALKDDALAQRVEPLLASLSGEQDQIPPSYSAKHVDGKRAYALARQGTMVELPAKRVIIHAIELISVQGQQVRLRVDCGSGVYIRALARDLAQQLGTLGYLASLTRTSCGGFSDSACIPFATLLASLRAVQDSLRAPDASGTL